MLQIMTDTLTPVFPDILGITNKYGASIYYEHEQGTDQVNSTATTAIPAFIKSGDWDITSRRSALGQANRQLQITGEMVSFLWLSDDLYLILNINTGNAKVTLLVSAYPDDVAVSSPLGPFTVTSTTDKVDTRARGRLVSVKIENDGTGETWRYGTLRLDAQPDGRR